MSSFLAYYSLMVASLFGINERENLTIESKVLGETRHVIIDLPDNYTSSPDKQYPIIILLDGESHLDITAESTRSSSGMNAIIVAIENVDRERDFTVTKIQTRRENTMGGGWNFLEFVEQELFPEIENLYRTSSRKILVGHSLGGLLAVNSYMDAQSPFDAFVAIDPSIWWDEETMQQKVTNIDASSFDKKLFIATANQGEANLTRNKLRHDRMVELLRHQMDEPENIQSIYYPDENHRTVPAASIKAGLQFVNEIE